MSAEVRNLYVVLSANTGTFRGQMVAAGATVRNFGSQVVGMSDQSARALDDLGRRSGRVGVGAGLVVAGISKAAIDWQSDFAGVEKTVDGTTQQLNQLEGELRDMARTMPATHEEIAATAAAAGQLGVATEDISDFTRVMVMMGETTNLSADDAATSIAQFMNVMQSAADDADEIGNTVVALGNKGASTEAQIVGMAQRLSGAGSLLNASEADVLGLAAAMANLGIESELGGGAIQRISLIINTAVAQGGQKLEGFADLAGTSADEFAEKWRTDPMMALQLLIDGLGQVKASGGDLVTTLAGLGIRGTQNLQVLLRLAGSGDMLTTSLNQSRDAWAENTALETEYAKRAGTDASQIQVAWNRIKDSAIDAGDVVLPIVADIADIVGTMTDAFGELPDPAQDALVAMLAITAVLGGGLWFGAKVVGGIRSTKTSLTQLRGETTLTNRGLSLTRRSLQGVLADLRAVATGWLTTGATASGQAAKMEAAAARGRLGRAGIRGAGLLGGTALLATGAADSTGLGNTATMALLGSAVLPGYGTAIGAVVGATMDLAAANDDLEASMGNVDAALAQGVAGFAQAQAGIKSDREEIDRLAESWSTKGDSFGEGLGESVKATFNPQFWREVFGDQLQGEIDRTNEQIQSLTDQEDALYGVGLALGQVFKTDDNGAVAMDLQDLTEVADRAQPALDALGYSWEQLAGMDRGELQTAADAIRAWLINADSAGGKTDALAGALAGLNDEMSTVEDRAGNLKDALDQLLGVNLSESAATDQWRQGLRSLNEDLAEHSRALVGNTAGAAQNRDVIRSRINDLQDMLVAEAEAGAGPMELARTLDSQREQLVKWGVQAGLNEDRLRGFIKEMGLTPKSISTIFETLGIDEADLKVRDLITSYNKLPKNVRTYVAAHGTMKAEDMATVLQERYGLTPEQIITVLEARDNASLVIDGVVVKLGRTDGDAATVIVDALDNASSIINQALRNLWNADGETATLHLRTVHDGHGPAGPGPQEDDGVTNTPDKSDKPPHDDRRRHGSRTTHRYGDRAVRSGDQHVTVIHQTLPEKIRLQVGDKEFTAYVRGHADDIARERIGQVEGARETRARTHVWEQI